MKKALLGTSALVGAGLLAFSPAPTSAADLELSISGGAIFGTYFVDGEDYSKGAQTSVNWGPSSANTVPNKVANQPYRLCWDEGGSAFANFDVKTGATPAACDAGDIQVEFGAASAGVIIPSGGTVVNRPRNGDTVEPNSTGISRGPNRLVFDTKGTLDNGLTVGSRVRVEARTVTDTDDVVDEHYAWVEGGFGLFQIGAKNAAAYQMHYTTPWFTNNGVDSPNFRNAQRSAGAGTETYSNLTEDAYKINYFTPRFGGVQFGASFVPNGSATKGTSGVISDKREVDLQNVYSLGLNYVQDFGGVSVSGSAGYETGTAREKDPDGGVNGCAPYGSFTPTTPFVGLLQCDDPSEWSVGTQVSMSGFTVGGAYNVAENIGGVRDTERTSWSTGVKYGMGDWSVGAAYYQGTVERGGSFFTLATLASPLVPARADWDDAETTFILLGAGYKLGTGVNVGAEIQIIEDTNAPPTFRGAGLGNRVAVGTNGPETLKTNSFGVTLGVSF